MSLSGLNTPGARLTTVLAVASLFVVLAVTVATEAPRTGFLFNVGDVLVSSQGQEVIEEIDLLSEPGDLPTKDVLWRFYERQGRLFEVLQGETLEVTSKGDVQSLSVAKARWTDLSLLFWIPVLVGFGSLAIAAWIWALRPRDLASRFFALSGVSMFVSAVPSAIYTSRELVLQPSLFRVLEELNALGASLFGISMIGLFLVYPVRLRRWRMWFVSVGLLLCVMTILFLLKLNPSWGHISHIIVLEMTAICVAIGAQFRATRGDPRARASLAWLGLSVILGAGAFVGFNTIPLILQLTPLHQGYAFSFFLIIYLGLAAGLTQFRLFEVGQWAFRVLYYAIGALILVLFDIGLVVGMGMDRLPALGLSLFAIGFMYLPLRDIFWRKISSQAVRAPQELVTDALHVAFAPSSAARVRRWQDLLMRLFDPLEVTTDSSPGSEVILDSDGLSMRLPAVAGAPAVVLSYPGAGRSLFSPQSKKVAQEIVSLIERAESNREAYDRGVLEERRRMAQDLHDDVGARLLTGLSLADERLRPTLQEALADIRSIVGGMSGEQVTVFRFLADLRQETAHRLTVSGILLSWDLEKEDSRELEYRSQRLIGSCVRELISNAIRHSGAKNVEVALTTTETEIRVSVRDDGNGAIRENSGFGLKNLRRRVELVGGELEIHAGSEGTRVSMRIPLLATGKTP